MNWIKEIIKEIIISVAVYLFIRVIIYRLIKIFDDSKSDKKKLKELEQRENEYYEDKRAAELKSKRVNTFARIVIGISIICVNISYYNHCIIEFENSLQEILSFNKALLLGYSFIALISAGTPEKLVTMINEGILRLCLYANIRNFDIDAIQRNISDLKERIGKESEVDN